MPSADIPLNVCPHTRAHCIEGIPSTKAYVGQTEKFGKPKAVNDRQVSDLNSGCECGEPQGARDDIR